jgi:hypothetical protein
MPSISCPHCKHSLTVNPVLAGQVVNCPACNQRVRLPAMIPAGTAAATPKPPQPAYPLPTFPAAMSAPAGLSPPAALPLPAPSAPAIPSSVSMPQPMPLTAAPFPPSLPKEGAGNVEVDTSARGIPFRPREYPALKVVMYVLYGFAILTACSFIISELLLIAGGTLGLFSGSDDSAADSFRRSSSALAAGGIMAFLLAQAITIGYHALAALWFVASAEMIRVFLDIQNNTHEAVHFVRQSLERRR